MSAVDRSGEITGWTTTAPRPVVVQHITVRQWLTARLATLLHLPAPKVGKRRADRARKPKKVGYLLSPAAVQLVTQTDKQVPAGIDQDTAPINVRRVIPTGQFTSAPKEDR